MSVKETCDLLRNSVCILIQLSSAFLLSFLFNLFDYLHLFFGLFCKFFLHFNFHVELVKFILYSLTIVFNFLSEHRIVSTLSHRFGSIFVVSTMHDEMFIHCGLSQFNF
jgi:hypothetical protein